MSHKQLTYIFKSFTRGLSYSLGVLRSFQ